MWYGVLAGSILAFIGIYAAHLGANSFEIGLLSAGPALISLFFSLPSGRWLEKLPLLRATYVSSVIQRMGYLLLVVFPLLLGEKGQIWAAVLVTLVISIPGTLLAISFNATLATLVPPEWRGHVVGRRNALVSISAAATALICGQILDRVAYPLNYQIVFGAGFAGAMVSSYHLARLSSPREAPISLFGFSLRKLRFPNPADLLDLRSSVRFELLRGPFGLFLLAYFLFYTFQYLPVPIFPLFYVNELHLSHAAISVGSSIFNFMVMAGSLRLGQVSDRFGHRKLSVVSAFAFCLYPLLLSFTQGPVLFYTASIIGGVIWAFLGGATVNRLMERTPEGDRPAHLALYNLALNLGVLAGSLLAPVLGEFVELRPLLILAAGLRSLAGLFLLLWG